MTKTNLRQITDLPTMPANETMAVIMAHHVLFKLELGKAFLATYFTFVSAPSQREWHSMLEVFVKMHIMVALVFGPVATDITGL